MTDDDALELLKRVVATPSVTGQEAAVAAVLVGAMAGSASEAFVDAAGNAVGRWGHGPRRVTFLGHMDTVPGHIDVRVSDGVLHGRGAVDAKGSLCMALAAAARLPGPVLERLSLRLIGAVEEEGPSSKGARFALTAYEPPDLVIIGEPSGWDAYTLGYKGRLMVRLAAERDNAHSSRDEATAAALVAEAWQRVRTFVEADNAVGAGLFDRLQIGLQDIRSDNDGLRQRCSAVLALRLPPRWHTEELERRLAAVALPAGVRLETQAGEAAYRGDQHSVLARAFRVGIRQQGGRPRPKLKTGTSDMNVVAPVWQVPMVAYGPGDAALDHTPREAIELAEYQRSIAVLQGVLTLLANDGAGHAS